MTPTDQKLALGTRVSFKTATGNSTLTGTVETYGTAAVSGQLYWVRVDGSRTDYYNAPVLLLHRELEVLPDVPGHN